MAAENTDRPRFVTRGPVIAILLTTIPGWVQGVIGATLTASIALSVVLALTLLIATLGTAWAERQHGDRAMYLVLSSYGIGVVLAMWLSSGRAFLVSMPLVSMVVLFLSTRVAIAVSVALALTSSCILVAPSHSALTILEAAGSLSSAYVFVIIFSFIARRERYARRDVERLSAQLETLAATRERNRIAREIHDSLGHYLTVANVQLEAARANPAGLDERLARVQQLLRDGLGELRRSVSMLRETTPTPQPFTQAIAELVDESRASGLHAELKTSGIGRPLPGAIGFTLYRAAQEALTNVQRHANAKRVEVVIAYADERVGLSVVDDGVGPSASGITAGNGLSGMRERVELVGGTLTTQRNGSSGFSVTIEVPG